MKEVHFEGKVAQKAVILRDGKVLVVRDPREKREIWEIPGGRLNVGENPKQGLVREIKEELGVIGVVGNVIHLTQFLQGSEQKNALMIAYEVTIPNETELQFNDGEVCEARWISADQVEDLNLFPEYRDTLNIYFQKMVE